MARARSKQRLSRRERQQKADTKGKLLIGALGAAVIGFGFLYWQVTSGIVSLDKVTMCPVDGPASVTAVVVDRTDTVTPIQRALLIDKFNEIRAEVPKHGLLEIYTVNPVKAATLKPEFALCNPGDGSELSQWTANPKLANKTWATAFNTPLQSVLDGMLEESQADQSPIMETIQSVAATAFAPNDNVPRTLIVISDLLQHSENLTQYRGVKKFDEFRTTPNMARVKSDLHDVSVRVLYIRRDTAKSIQGNDHIRFWEAYFADQGGLLSNAVSIF